MSIQIVNTFNRFCGFFSGTEHQLRRGEGAGITEEWITTAPSTL